MKHLLNNLSEEEKNSIREQHEGGMKLDTSRFRTLLESKSGNVKPLVEQDEPSTEDMPLDPIEDELDEMVGVDYMSDELGESSSLSSNRGLEKLIEKHRLDQILTLFDNDEDLIDEMMSTFEPLGITSYDELVDYKGEDEDEDFGFAKHSGDFDGDDSEEDDEEELDLREFDDLEEDDETW